MLPASFVSFMNVVTIQPKSHNQLQNIYHKTANSYMLMMTTLILLPLKGP